MSSVAGAPMVAWGMRSPEQDDGPPPDFIRSGSPKKPDRARPFGGTTRQDESNRPADPFPETKLASFRRGDGFVRPPGARLVSGSGAERVAFQRFALSVPELASFGAESEPANWLRSARAYRVIPRRLVIASISRSTPPIADSHRGLVGALPDKIVGFRAFRSWFSATKTLSWRDG